MRIRRTANNPGAIREALQSTPGRRTSGLGRKLLGPVVIVAVVVGVLAFANYWLNSGKIYGGVEAGSVALGGLTREEARTAVGEQSTGALQSVRLTNSGTEPESFSISAEEMGVRFDAGSTVDKAYAVGREGNIVQRLARPVRRGYRHGPRGARRCLQTGGSPGAGRKPRRPAGPADPQRLRRGRGPERAGIPGPNRLRAGRARHPRKRGSGGRGPFRGSRDRLPQPGARRNHRGSRRSGREG